MFIIPPAPGTAGGLGGAGLDHDHAMAVRPPAGAPANQSTALLATACVAAGSCAAGGYFAAGGRMLEPMVATQAHGHWSRGAALRLPANAAAQPYAEVTGVACRTAGNCVAVGNYEYGQAHSPQAFIATESGGTWARAFTPRLPAGAAPPGSAQLQAVTCMRDGSCEAVGSYQDSSGSAQTMVLAKPASGPWRQATTITAPAGAAQNPDANMTGISCTAPGSCVAVGNYSISASQFAAMGAVESRGTWHHAAEIAAPRGAIASTFTAITSVACVAAGTCLGVGQYAVSATQSHAMAVTVANGRFGPAEPITAVPPGASPMWSSYLLGVSCVPSGTCLAVGGGRNATGHPQAMYMTRAAGRWRAAFLLAPAGATAGQRQLSVLYSVSCTGRGHCTAVGYYHDSLGIPHAEAASTR